MHNGLPRKYRKNEGCHFFQYLKKIELSSTGEAWMCVSGDDGLLLYAIANLFFYNIEYYMYVF